VRFKEAWDRFMRLIEPFLIAYLVAFTAYYIFVDVLSNPTPLRVFNALLLVLILIEVFMTKSV